MNAITAQHHRTLGDAEHDHLTAIIGRRFSELVAAGYACSAGASWRVSVRVTSGGVRTTYCIDRWE